MDAAPEPSSVPLPEPALTLRPIGYVRTAQRLKFAARHQPVDTAEERHTLELLPGGDYELGLRDLAGFDRIWLVWWFHRNETWRPLVLPPRGPARRRGVFATRSPHRPNPLGLTPVRLLGVEGLTLHLGPCDLVDGTPVFDIKPYVPAYDVFPEAKAGWIDEVDAAMAEPPRYAVVWTAEAEAQAAWLREHHGIDFTARLRELLERDPTPHRTRRIGRRADGTLEIGCGAWRAVFTLVAETVTIVALESGYPLRLLHQPGEAVADRGAQLAFIARWGPGKLQKPLGEPSTG